MENLNGQKGNQELVIKSFLEQLADGVALIAIKYIGYWSGNLYDFKVSEDAADLALSDDKGNKWLIVVGREYYYEGVKDYPVGRVGDVRSILKNEPWRYPFRGRLFYRIERLSEQSHRVTSWVVKQQVIDNFKAPPLLILPESVCLDSDGFLALNRLGDTLFVGNSADGLVSGLSCEGQFRQKMGISEQVELGKGRDFPVLSGSDSVDAILLGIVRVLTKTPLVFFVWPSFLKLPKIPWVKTLKLSSMVALLYLSLISTLIYLSDVRLDEKLLSMKPDTDAILDLRANLASNKAMLESIQTKLSGTSPIWIGWDVFLDLKALDVQFIAINTTATTMEIFCMAPKATDVLRFLALDPRIESSEFGSAVKQDGKLERFSVRLNFIEVKPQIDSLGQSFQELDSEGALNKDLVSPDKGDISGKKI